MESLAEEISVNRQNILLEFVEVFLPVTTPVNKILSGGTSQVPLNQQDT
jgi:hypothetical protein